MRSLCAVVAFLLFSASAAAMQDGIPLETLARIKDATVYIKADYGSGSGFIMKVEGTSALVITNQHVVEPEEVGLFGRRRGPFPMPPFPFPGLRARNTKVTVVLYSGTPQEESVSGEILGADPELDLAVIKISDVKKMPAPIDCSQDLKLVETMPVYTFGFPFGKVLATSQRGPAVTIGKGSISSLRLDDDGELTRVQIDGALNPGNSGGPVVDSQGRLIGVAVATIAHSSGIGLIIPAKHLAMMSHGRLGKPNLSTGRSNEDQLVIHLDVRLIDPFRKIQSVAMHYMAAKEGSETPQPDARLSQLDGCRKLPLHVQNQVATGVIFLRKGVTELKFLYQLVCTTSDGKESVTKSTMQTVSLPPQQVAQRRETKPDTKPGAKPETVSPTPSPRNIPMGPEFIRRDRSPGPETLIIGGHAGQPFTDAAPEGGVLIGFEVGLGKWFDSDVVHAMRPVFRTAKGEEVLGKQHGTDTSRLVVVKAKPGYAVGSITAKGMLLLDGFSVTFMKVGKDGLDTKDTYQSDWVAGKGGGFETILGGDGRLVIGIVGREERNVCNGMGLLRKQ